MEKGITVRRWTDKALIGAIGLIVSLVGFMWVTLAQGVSQAQQVNGAQDVRLERMDTTMKILDTRLDRMESKIDQIMDRLQK